jgi:hypothetical protein
MAEKNNSTFGAEIEAVPEKEKVVVPPSDFVPPDARPYHGEVNGAGKVRVSTAAIDYFNRQLGLIAPRDGSGFVKGAMDAVSAVDIKPGAFARAGLLQQKINGDGSGQAGLKLDTLLFLRELGDVLIMLQDSLDAVSKSYRETEDDSKITSDRLDRMMNDTARMMDGWANSGQSEWIDTFASPDDDGSQDGVDKSDYDISEDESSPRAWVPFRGHQANPHD